MGTRDPRIDVYIENSAEFAQPVLQHIRELVHNACPDVGEAMKWSHPHFLYHGMMCGMASFKRHCAFGFWKASLILDPADSESGGAMGSFGPLTSVKDLPSKRVLTGYVKQAMKLNVAGIVVPKKPSATRNAVPGKDVHVKGASVRMAVPPALVAALDRNRKALDTFDAFSQSARKEYIEWITEAKSEGTRDRRLEQAVLWMAEGKQRNWKYQK